MNKKMISVKTFYTNEAWPVKNHALRIYKEDVANSDYYVSLGALATACGNRKLARKCPKDSYIQVTTPNNIKGIRYVAIFDVFELIQKMVPGLITTKECHTQLTNAACRDDEEAEPTNKKRGKETPENSDDESSFHGDDEEEDECETPIRVPVTRNAKSISRRGRKRKQDVEPPTIVDDVVIHEEDRFANLEKLSRDNFANLEKLSRDNFANLEKKMFDGFAFINKVYNSDIKTRVLAINEIPEVGMIHRAFEEYKIETDNQVRLIAEKNQLLEAYVKKTEEQLETLKNENGILKTKLKRVREECD